MVERVRSEPLVGGDILSLITTGMYDNPLSVYREYIQNSADAIADAGTVGEAQVSIFIDPASRRIRIYDNGPGLSHKSAIRALLPIARSQKHRSGARGFLGIGRLSGLAVAESVAFTTRDQADRPLTRIVWNGAKLRSNISNSAQFHQIIRECVTIETLPTQKHASHFFETEMIGISRHVAASILNRNVVRSYIGEVCPVPFSSAFPFDSQIKCLFGKNKNPLELKIILDGESTPIYRPHGNVIPFSKDTQDHFIEFEEVKIPSVSRKEQAAVGWVAHSAYLGAIPKEQGIRGIRARIGNMQIGDETIFDSLFLEERFNRWCVGEISITDPHIVPNSRRDYFQLGPHTRNLENQLRSITARIAAKCRASSLTRNKQRRLQSELCKFEDTYDLAASGYLSSLDANALISRTLSDVRAMRKDIDEMPASPRENLQKLNEIEGKFKNFRARRGRPAFGGVKPSEVATYRKIFDMLVQVSPSPRAARETIQAILTRAQFR